MRWVLLKGLSHVLLDLHLSSGDVADDHHCDVPVCVGLPRAVWAKQSDRLGCPRLASWLMPAPLHSVPAIFLHPNSIHKHTLRVHEP